MHAFYNKIFFFICLDESQEQLTFEGKFALFNFNNYDVLEPYRRIQNINSSKKLRYEYTKEKFLKKKQNNLLFNETLNKISIESEKNSFIMFSRSKVDKVSSVYQISLKFRTLLSNALIFFMVNDENSQFVNEINGNIKLGKILGDFAIIQLINGRLKYTYGFQKGNKYAIKLKIYLFKLYQLKI